METPFDRARLDRLMEEAGIDLVLATTKHCAQYLLGGYKFFFFAEMDAIGLSRYMPAVGYPRGRPELAFYIGNPMEVWQQEHEPPWTPQVRNSAWTTEAVAEEAARFISAAGLERGTIAVEMPFLPADSFARLGRLLAAASIVDAVPLLQELRAVKRPDELALIRDASDAIVASMLSTIAQAGPGVTTARLEEILRLEEIRRGLAFDYLLVAAGPSLNRAPSAQTWDRGASLSLDSGGNKRGYIGDLARMAVMGRPSDQMIELLQEVDAVQMAARRPVRAGALGGEIYESAERELGRLDDRACMVFEAHGMGLVSHEAPHLTGSGNVPYPGTHALRPLESGMVLSLETTMRHPQVGYVKLEDTVVVTDTGCEGYGDSARGWNVAGG